MNSFLKSVQSITNKRNDLIKDSLQKQLNTCVMEMQSAPGVEEGLPVGNCDETMTLCSALEAVFLHGLKDSLLNRVTEVLSGPDFDAMPQPSFWGPLLVFSHRQIIDQIQAMPQITTEVGYCRAWIRLAMNEGLLSSYLYSIRRDNSALKPYYDRAAFIRDTDLVDVAQRLVDSLDYVHFELACNSSLLNFWSSTPLLMAAIWSPPIKSCPVVSAVDIAKTINSEATSNNNFDDVETASSIGSLSSFNSSLSMLNGVPNLTDDETLKMIFKQERQSLHQIVRQSNGASPSNFIKKVDKETKLKEDEPQIEKSSPSTEAKEIEAHQTIEESPDEAVTQENANPVEISNEIEKKPDESNSEETEVGEKNETTNAEAVSITIGNSLIGRPGWSTSFEDVESSMTASMISRSSDAPRTPGEGSTYDALLKSYHTAGYSTSPDLQDFLDNYAGTEPIPREPQRKPQPEIKVLDNLEEQIGRISHEKGLDVQDYSCFECDEPIGMTFGKAHVCAFSGNYYCTNCMSNEEFLIPSRIIHNWDLKHYPVCRRVGDYLTDCKTLLNLKILNPRIYMAVDSMAQLQSLRIRLNLLRAYLFSCREPIIESLQKRVAPREYLYEHVHQYSVADLLDVPSGALAQQLQKVVEFARQHVLSCWLCSQKGFICEVCSNPKVIYPFDMESTYRCSVCNAVFHADCLSSNKPCPKCKRRRERMDRLPMDANNVELHNGETTPPPPPTKNSA